MKPEEVSLEHMSVQEAIDNLGKASIRGRLRRRWRLAKYAVKKRINLWFLSHEAKHENPKGGAAEVARLRKMLVIERSYNEKVR